MRESKNLLIAAVLITSPGHAQDALNDLDRLIVTASRTTERIAETPYSVAVLDSTVFSTHQARTLPDALGLIPGVLVQKTARGHGSPYIRGFTGRQNLYLVDGIRLNNSSWRSGPAQYSNTIDPYMIDRLEVVKGQGSVLYGSDAIGGTVNVISKDSGFREVADGERFHHGAAIYRFDSNSESHVGRVETRFGEGGRYGVMLGVSGKEYGDIRDSANGLMRHTGYPEQNVDFKLEYALAQDVTLTLAHQYLNQDDIWRWHSTIYNLGWEHDGHVAAPGSFLSRIYDQERSLSYAKIEGENADSWVNRWSATLSFQRQNESEYQLRTLSDERLQWTQVETYGLAFQLESELGPGTLVYGGDYYRDEVDSDGVRNGVVRPDFRPVADNSRYETLGVFAQYRWQPIEPLTVTAGTRYTRADASLGRYYDPASATDLSAERDWDNLVSSLRGVFQIDDCWNVYGGVSQGFRAPNLDDLSGNLTSRSGQTSLGNVNVAPEEFVNYELGLRHDDTDWTAGLAVFYTDIRDVVTSVPATAGSSTVVTTNGQDGHVYGIELEAAWRISPAWTLSGFASWQEGQTETQAFLGGPDIEEPPSRLMPLAGQVALRYTHPGPNVWVEGRVTGMATADRLSSGDQTDTQRIPTDGTPSYIVASLHAGWQATDSLLVTLGLENLTDEDYRIHGSGQNESGFNAIAGVQWTW